MLGITGNNVDSVKLIGRRDMSMDTNAKALFDENDRYYYHPYFNDAKELFQLDFEFIS